MQVDLTQEKYVDIYHKLQKAYLEFNGYQNIIFYMIDNDKTDNYDIYWERYITQMLEYEKIKREFETIVVMPETENQAKRWEIDFDREVVNITV